MRALVFMSTNGSYLTETHNRSVPPGNIRGTTLLGHEKVKTAHKLIGKGPLAEERKPQEAPSSGLRK